MRQTSNSLSARRDVHGRLEDRLIVKGFHRARGAAPAAITGHARDAHLHAHITEALRHVTLGRLHHVGVIGAIGVRVGIGGLAALAAGQLVHGHSGLAAFDVPEGLVDAA